MASIGKAAKSKLTPDQQEVFEIALRSCLEDQTTAVINNSNVGIATTEEFILQRSRKDTAYLGDLIRGGKGSASSARAKKSN